MSTGRRSRKAKSAASDMFKRFARGEDLLVESASKYSYSVGQKQVKEQPVRKKPHSTPGTPERHALPTADKCDPPNKTKPQSDDTGSRDVPTTRLKKPTKTMLKLKVIPQVAPTDNDVKMSLKAAASKCKQVRKGSSNDRQIVVIQKRKTLPIVATKPSVPRYDGCEGDAHKDSSTTEEPCKPEVCLSKRDNMRFKCSPTTEKVAAPLTPKKRAEDNLWSHNKNFSLSPRVKVVSPLPMSERPTEGVYTVSVLTNLAQSEAKLDIKKEVISSSPSNQTVMSTSQQRERHSSPVAAVSKCVSPIQRISVSGTDKSPANPTSDLKCMPTKKTLRVVVKESATKSDNVQSCGTFTKIKRVKIKPHACSKRRHSSPLPYPSDNITQDKFFHIFGLVKKSVLAKDVSITNKLHREAGGKLRRIIKPCMKPEMVYRRLELARGCIIQGLHEKFEALNEWKSKPGGLQDKPRVFMYDERRKRHEILEDNKVALLAAIPVTQRSKPSMKAGSDRASPATDVALMKDLKDSAIVKSARKLCFDSHLESPKHALKQYLKPRAKKRKHLTFDGSSDAIKTLCTETCSSDVSAENLSKKVAESQMKDKEAKSTGAAMPPSSPVPSRRSARQQGGKRKMWCHLLRAAPDEYIVDQQWETEQLKKEEKRRARLWRNAGEESAEASHENSSNEDDMSSKHSTTSDLPADHDAAVTQRRSEIPTEDSATSSPLAKRIKIEPDGELGLIDESSIKVEEQTDVVKHRKKKKKKKRPPLNDDGMSVPVNVISPDGHPLSQNKRAMLFEQLKPVLNDIVNNSSKFGDDVIFVPNNNKESLECNETLPYVFSSSAGASPSGTWAGNERYRYADHECTIPHMCMVCWINDHMYCKNMKRVARDLPPCGGCIHYIPCKHYRHLKDMQNYSRKNITKLTPPTEKSASATLNRGDAKASPTDLHKAQLSTDDLLCYEEMLESDSDPSSPDTPAGTEILKAHLKARASQIAKSLGVKRLSSLNNLLPEVLVLPAEDKSAGDRGGVVDVCEYAAEVILFSDNGFNYTRVHEPMLTGVHPHHVPMGRTVRADTAPKAVKEVGSKSIISAVKDIKMPGKFCIRVAHQGGAVKPGVSATDGQKVIKVKVQRVEPKKLLLQAMPSGGEIDDSKISSELIPEEREICLPANKRGDADFDSDLLGGIIAQEAMKLVSSGNFRPQLLKLTFDGDVTLPFSKVDVKKEPGISEKRKSKKKVRKKQREENLGFEERNLNLVDEPCVSWLIETLPEDLDAMVKEDPVDLIRWPSSTCRMAHTNQEERLMPCEHGTEADATASKQTTVKEHPSDLQQKHTDSKMLAAATARDLRKKKPEVSKKQYGQVEPGASCGGQKKTTHHSKKPAEIHDTSHKQTEKTSLLPPVECDTTKREEEVAPLQLHEDQCAKKRHTEGMEDTNNLLHGEPHVETTDKVDPLVSGDISTATSNDDTIAVDHIIGIGDRDVRTVTDSASAMECDTIAMDQVGTSVDSDIHTVTNSADTVESDTSIMDHAIGNVESNIRIVSSGAITIESDTSTVCQVVSNIDTVTNSTCAMKSDTGNVNQVVSYVDTVTNSTSAVQSDTNTVIQVVSNVDTVTNSACAMESDTITVDQVVGTHDSDVGSFDSGIASFDSAFSSTDYSADHADSGVSSSKSIINTTVGADSSIGVDNTPNSGVNIDDGDISGSVIGGVINVSGGVDVIDSVTNVSVADTCELTEVSVASTISINSSTQNGATDGSEATLSSPYQNQMTLDEFLESMTLAGVTADEIASLRQQLVCVRENEVIELVTASPQQTVCDQLSTSGEVDAEQENVSTASTPVCVNGQNLGSSQELCDSVEMEVSESTVVTHDDVQMVGSKIETESSIVEGQADDLGPFVICDGQIVHYDAQTGVLMAVEGAALEEVSESVVGETADIAYSTQKSYVFASDDLCQSVDSSSMDECDIAQIASQSLA